MNMKLVFNWTPFAFCALLVSTYVIGGSSSSTDNWKYFSLWLTMCFFFVCAITYSMQKQIEMLRRELQALAKLERE